MYFAAKAKIGKITMKKILLGMLAIALALAVMGCNSGTNAIRGIDGTWTDSEWGISRLILSNGNFVSQRRDWNIDEQAPTGSWRNERMGTFTSTDTTITMSVTHLYVAEWWAPEGISPTGWVHLDALLSAEINFFAGMAEPPLTDEELAKNYNAWQEGFAPQTIQFSLRGNTLTLTRTLACGYVETTVYTRL